MRFSCAVVPTVDPTQVREICEASSRYGFDRFWLPDQEFYADPFVLLADLAAHTDIDLGLALTNPFSRHPVQIARAMATVIRLDRRSRSWVLGMGMGNSNLVLGPLGVDDRASRRRMLGSVDIVRRLMRRDTVEPDGTGYLRSAVSLTIEPAVCPVYVGSRGPRMIEEAAPVCDGLITESLFTAQAIAWAKERGAGRHGAAHVVWQSVHVIEKDEPLPAHVRDFATMLLRTTTLPVQKMLGISPRVQEKSIAGDLAAPDLADEDVRKLIAVGTADEIRTMVDAAARAGADEWSCVFLGRPSEILASIETFGKTVIDPLRRDSGRETRSS